MFFVRFLLFNDAGFHGFVARVFFFFFFCQSIALPLFYLFYLFLFISEVMVASNITTFKKYTKLASMVSFQHLCLQHPHILSLPINFDILPIIRLISSLLQSPILHSADISTNPSTPSLLLSFISNLESILTNPSLHSQLLSIFSFLARISIVQCHFFPLR